MKLPVKVRHPATYRNQEGILVTDRKPEFSDVIVTFNDGQVKTYRISAGAGVSAYLAMQAGQSGVLALHNKADNSSWSIPLGSIREWELKGVAEEQPDA